jgi:heme-degrading monooxygenase HmoA
MIALIVRFKSRLSYEEVLKIAEDRADRFRALDGLAQKYYLNYAEKDEYGAVYLWESEEALQQFRDSELAATIAGTYGVEGALDLRVAEVIMPLRVEGK